MLCPICSLWARCGDLLAEHHERCPEHPQNVKVERDRLRKWCEAMADGLVHAVDLTYEMDGVLDEIRNLRHHLLGTLTDEESGQAIPKLLAEAREP